MAPMCSLLLLLPLLPHSTAALSKSKPPARYRYHTLRATPLSLDPIARSDAAQPLFTAAGETSWNSTTPATPPPSAWRLLLAHREAFAPPNATAAQLLEHRLARDAARAEAVSAAARNGTRAGGFAAPVVSGLAQGSGEYFAQVGVGTAAVPALLVLDTGSDVVWLQCAPCRRCYAQSGRVFDPRRSRSFAAASTPARAGATGAAGRACTRSPTGTGPSPRGSWPRRRCRSRRARGCRRVRARQRGPLRGRGGAAGARPRPAVVAAHPDGGFSLFDTCYDLRGRRVVKVPTVSVHLAGGAEVALPPENYLIPVDTRGTFCLALAGTDGGVSIVGNIQQQGGSRRVRRRRAARRDGAQELLAS